MYIVIIVTEITAAIIFVFGMYPENVKIVASIIVSTRYLLLLFISVWINAHYRCVAVRSKQNPRFQSRMRV
jgi:hypothetical protein